MTNTASQIYHNMQGVNVDGMPYIDPSTKKETRFMYAGDPVQNTGWTLVTTEGPGECYFQTNSGPFIMLPGQQQQIVVALLVAQGTDRLNSLAGLKLESRLLTECFRENSKVSVPQVALPDHATLHQNFPNPFNTTTTLAFTLPRSASVQIEIHNCIGQRIRSWPGLRCASGLHRLVWDGRNETGRTCPAGVYFYSVKLDNATLTKKLLLLR